MKDKSLGHWKELNLQWIKGVKEGKPLYSDLSEEQIQNAYHSAYDLYKKKNYSQALYFFQVLTWLRPLDKKYWKGLGACQQVLKNYFDALQSYQCFQELCQDQIDLYVSIHQADCLFALDQVDKGLELLQATRLHAEAAENRQVIYHVCLMHDIWSKQTQLI
jgi:secretion system chaperone SscA